jgi:hypothetical protein
MKLRECDNAGRKPLSLKETPYTTENTRNIPTAEAVACYPSYEREKQFRIVKGASMDLYALKLLRV